VLRLWRIRRPGLRRFLLMFFACALACDPVCAHTLTDWAPVPTTSGIGDRTALLGAIASGAGYVDNQDSGIHRFGGDSI
jgi:hypothetical protein